MVTRAVDALPAVDGPYLQGQLDTLCGIYSAINGLAAVLASVRPLRGGKATQLFHHAIAFVAQRMTLADAVTDGIGPELWLDLLHELAGLLKAGPGRAISIERPFADTAIVRFFTANRRFTLSDEDAPELRNPSDDAYVIGDIGPVLAAVDRC